VSKGKSVVVTFRVDEHLAEALNSLPDKSAFIRQALQRALHEACPACGGEGVVDCEAAGWIRDVLSRNGARRCSCCGTAYPAKHAEEAALDEARCGHCNSDGHGH
jgi:hypothetical protein